MRPAHADPDTPPSAESTGNQSRSTAHTAPASPPPALRFTPSTKPTTAFVHAARTVLCVFWWFRSDDTACSAFWRSCPTTAASASWRSCPTTAASSDALAVTATSV